MAKGLVIVESPAKASTLKRYLGKDMQVLASVGHIKNLPKSKLGVDIDNGYTPEFVTIKGKAKVIKEIKAAAKKADVIYLAPDPDREGEAIADHIASEIGEGKILYRVTFNEITKKAVQAAIANPGVIDQNRVYAQNARRILDRLVGYKLSPLLWDKVRKGLSAGRVQSVALRLIVEREREIEKFKAVEYWTIEGSVEATDPPAFDIKLLHINGKKAEIGGEAEAATITEAIKKARLAINKIEKKERKRNPVPPFITSTLQQEASRKLRYNARRTMSIAQRLYEGLEVGEEGQVGLITYMRTDSTRIADEAVEATRAYVTAEYGAPYLPKEAVVYKTKKSAQDAHEAIRPTDVTRSPDKVKKFLSKEEFSIYELIWKRFVACQMSSAVMDVTTVDVETGPYTLRATGSIMKFAGFLKVYEETVEDKKGEDDDGKDKRLPETIREGEALKLLTLEQNQHFTQPPPRYTEAALIRSLEEVGIGRPSTYAGIVSTIQEREYTTSDDRRLSPTELGTLVTDLLVENFPDILNTEFTAQMENELDQVEEGKKEWTKALDDFYKPFEIDLEKAKLNMRNVKAEAEKTDIVCDKCGKPMVIKFGRFGKFVACSGYPECKNTMKLAKDGSIQEKPEQLPDEPTDFTCPTCGKPMVKRHGRFGEFIACVDYPTCKTTKQIGIGVACPREGCGGELVRKMTRMRKVFYGCDQYPKCDFAVWDEPYQEKCPDCGHPFLVKKHLKKGTFIRCPVKECGYVREAPELAPESSE
jgi:DNA topoisomerase-1